MSLNYLTVHFPLVVSLGGCFNWIGTLVCVVDARAIDLPGHRIENISLHQRRLAALKKTVAVVRGCGGRALQRKGLDASSVTRTWGWRK